MPPQKILITGVYGLVGNIAYRHLNTLTDRYEVYGLDRQRLASERAHSGGVMEVPAARFFEVDLANREATRAAVQGMDKVVQLAADPRPEAEWETILPSNVIGPYHVLEACKQAGVKRVIYGSSVMAVWSQFFSEPFAQLVQHYGVEADWNPGLRAAIPRLTRDTVPRPGELYGASKAWGEALAHIYAINQHFSCLCVRFGAIYPRDEDKTGPNPLWCSHRDTAQIIERCLDAPATLTFDIFYGLSDTGIDWIDLDHAREIIGYVPLDRE